MAMQVQRHDPSAAGVSLRTMMDRLFEDSFVHPLGNVAASGAIALDVAETNDAYIVTAALPGVKPDDVQIMAHGNVVTIRAETHAEQEERDGRFLVKERRAGKFERTLTLPETVDADKAEAKLEDGELVLTLPKSDAAKPKQIKVRNPVSLLRH